MMLEQPPLSIPYGVFSFLRVVRYLFSTKRTGLIPRKPYLCSEMGGACFCSGRLVGHGEGEGGGKNLCKRHKEKRNLIKTGHLGMLVLG